MPAGYLYMNVGNGKRDLPSQSYGNTMLKLQPPMNACGTLYQAACCFSALNDVHSSREKVVSSCLRHGTAQGC